MTALACNLDQLGIQPLNLNVTKGNVTDVAGVEPAMKVQDAVYSALGSLSLKKNSEPVEDVRNSGQTMEKQGVQHFVVSLH